MRASSLRPRNHDLILAKCSHRLKGRKSQIAGVIRNLDLAEGKLLLLTGTPIQNNTNELL